MMQNFIQLFQDNKTRFSKNIQMFEKLLKQGFPTLRNEDWKHTNIAPIVKKKWLLPVEPAEPQDVSAYTINLGLDCDVVLIADGIGTDNNINIGLENNNPFVLLSNIFAETGFIINIPDNFTQTNPIHIIHLMTDKASDQMFNQRNLINIGKDSNITIIETFISESNAIYFNNLLSEINLQPRAKLIHIKIQQESQNAYHINNTFINQEEQSHYQHFCLTIGAKISRQEIQQNLVGMNSQAMLKGIYLLNNKQVADQHFLINHKAPQTKSDIYYKGICEGSSRAVFNGKVVVAQDAQKTHAKQSNKNLLLSRDADINTKPELEIYADDVKCSHGTTVGQLDENAVFYLKSRGIDTHDAIALLTYAFAVDLLEQIEPVELKGYFEHLVKSAI